MQPTAIGIAVAPGSVPVTGGLPPNRIRPAAIAVSLLAHGALLAALVFAPPPSPPEPEPLVRLVFVEPPPPPPPPAVAVAPEPVAPVVQPKPKPQEPKVVAKKPKRLEPVVEKPVEAPPAPEPVEPASVEPPGVAGGVAGGTPGGTVGGIAGGRGTGPVPVGQVARPPALVKRVMPEYPPVARRRGIEGMVRLEAILDTRGRIEQPIRVLESIAALDESAIDALRQWRFSPARDAHGEPVRVILEVPIQFVLR